MILKRRGQPSKMDIIAGVLKGHISNPRWFLVSSKMNLNGFLKSFELQLPANFVKTYGLVAWLYIRLQKKGFEQKQAFEIVRKVMLTFGLAIQQTNFRTIDKERTFKNLILFQQQNNREGNTRFNEMEIIEQNERRYEFRIHTCMFNELFKSLGVDELTSIMCSVDNAIFNSYLPEQVTFHRNGLYNTIFHGKPYCEFVFDNHIN